jgi:hypothetical protein
MPVQAVTGWRELRILAGPGSSESNFTGGALILGRRFTA